MRLSLVYDDPPEIIILKRGDSYHAIIVEESRHKSVLTMERPTPTITAALEHLLNMTAEHLANIYDNFHTDCPTPLGRFGETVENDFMVKALEDLLELTCMMVDSHRKNPTKWRRQFARLVKNLLHQSPFPNMIVGEEDTVEVSPVLPRGRKRNASVMDSIEENEHSAGFTRLSARVHPSPNRRETFRRDIASGFLLPPARDARSAAASCASLPSIISDGAEKMLYELLIRPQFPPPTAGVSLSQITRDTSLENLDMIGYLHDLERLGKARQTGPVTWLPVGSPEDSDPSVIPHDSHRISARPGSSKSREISFSGFPILSSAIRGIPNPKYFTRHEFPVGDATLATTACAALPYNISDGAKELLYDLVTRRQHGQYRGVSLLSIKRDTGLQLPLLLQYAEELRDIERADHSSGNCWYPTNLPAAHQSVIMPSRMTLIAEKCHELGSTRLYRAVGAHFQYLSREL
jgi:hypothetical protein